MNRSFHSHRRPMLLAAAAVLVLAVPAGAEIMRCQGDGLTITVTQFDQATGQVAGQVTVDGQTSQYLARIVHTPLGGQYATGQVNRPGGAVPIRIVDESATVARVTIAGRLYRVTRGGEAQPGHTPRPGPGPSVAGDIVLKQHTLVDKGSRNMESHTVLAPEGWTVEGGAWWAPQQFFKTMPSRDIKVTSAEGVQVRVAPAVAAKETIPAPHLAQLGIRPPAELTSDGGYLVLYLPQNVEGWKQFIREKSFSEKSRPNATNLQIAQVSVIPELTMLLKRELEPIWRQEQQMNQLANQAGMNNFSDAVVLGAHLTYTEGGRQWEELFVFGVSWLGLDGPAGRELWWSIEPNIIFRAPLGQLDGYLPLLRTISTSVQPTPQWSQMRAQHLAKMSQISAEGAAKRQAIWRKTSEEIFQIQQEGRRNREAIRDKTHQMVINTIRGTAQYSTGSGQGLTVPNSHNYVWTNGSGQVILTNNAMYNPGSDPKYNTQNWSQMKQVN